MHCGKEGRKKGRKEGKKEGKKEGRSKGRTEERRVRRDAVNVFCATDDGGKEGGKEGSVLLSPGVTVCEEGRKEGRVRRKWEEMRKRAEG